MTIITRKRADQYAIIPNAVASDDRLTFEERGVLVYLLAKPHDWNVSVKNLQNQGGIGRDKVYRILQKLEEVGYLKREQTKSSDGRFGAYNYTVHDDAVPESLPLPRPENQEAGAPRPENTQAASPLPEKPVTGNPLNGESDTYKEPTKPKSPLTPLTGGTDGLLDKMISIWPQEHLGKRDAAERELQALPVDKRQRAADCIKVFLRHCTLRRERVPRLSVYLSGQMFEIVYGAPDLDSAGYYRIHPDRAEWPAWLEYVRRKHGEAKAEKVQAERLILGKTRWPVDLSLANSVTNLATSGTVTDTASATRA
ncbi:helix-turn-helix domain-containing protein [Mesorhizobium sp. M2A.F.Ca.ET.067.02.1.1]|uniref:helix-turn-helix domain-containing protein n=1 Tax=Mesorhizobium sp. M2A.F.Ca.ET.067.02.1.1 TaxID=2496749 RepID=UPI000FD58D1A|nr:helix-turn-helix domain-containing protein [Mesorhizobium sp. M2A.F.Ca.ET.067.02.1.1]RUW81529.1 helix-turn-helix domain-containing protein [Mesorhizobium sp. M2A.F.Ca.ET.067.02.1.1]TIU58143.1 MAG: hypothetical protein E5W35_05980 [Mesorhizobium sp.]